jgi:hypothetical protein
MDYDDTKPPTLGGTESPLFEPEVPTRSLLPDLPFLATDDNTGIIDLSALSNDSTEEQEHVSPFIQKLRTLETDARSEMSSWDPKYLSQDPDINTAAPVAGAKRKGMCQIVL